MMHTTMTTHPLFPVWLRIHLINLRAYMCVTWKAAPVGFRRALLAETFPFGTRPPLEGTTPAAARVQHSRLPAPIKRRSLKGRAMPAIPAAGVGGVVVATATRVRTVTTSYANGPRNAGMTGSGGRVILVMGDVSFTSLPAQTRASRPTMAADAAGSTGGSHGWALSGGQGICCVFVCVGYLGRQLCHMDAAAAPSSRASAGVTRRWGSTSRLDHSCVKQGPFPRPNLRAWLSSGQRFKSSGT